MDRPTERAVLADYWTAYDLHSRGMLEQYMGQFVAVVAGKVVGADPDPARLRQTVSAALQVDPERIAIIQLPDQCVIVSPRCDFATDYGLLTNLQGDSG